MVPFAGWEMPVQYQGVIPEHQAVRRHAGPLRRLAHGPARDPRRRRDPVRAADALERHRPDRAGQAQYTLLLNERGCPIDDLIAYRFADDHVLLVVNASRVAADHDWLAAHVPGDAELEDLSDGIAMLALQGPDALGLVELPELRRSASSMRRCAACARSSPAPATPASRASSSCRRREGRAAVGR